MLGEFVDGATKLAAHIGCRLADHRGVAQHVGVEKDGDDKPEDKFRYATVPRFCFSLSLGEGLTEEERGDQGQNHDPERTRQFDGRCHFECAHSLRGDPVGVHLVVGRAGSHDGGGVVDGDGGPHAKLLHRHAQGVADVGKEKEGDAIEHKHYAEGHAHALRLGLDDWTDGSNGRTTTDGRARTEQIAGLRVHVEQFASKDPAQSQGSKDTCDGEDHALAARSQRLIDVHAKAQSDDGILQ